VSGLSPAAFLNAVGFAGLLIEAHRVMDYPRPFITLVILPLALEDY
jgi:hypothetical protein